MITLLVTLVVFGLIAWLIDRYIPMLEPIRTVFRVVIVLLLIVWLLQAFGLVTLPFRLR